MSYARFSSDSDVYIYWDVGGYVCCCGCQFAAKFGAPECKLYSFQEALIHLVGHMEAGDKVPSSALFYLILEMRSGLDPTKTQESKRSSLLSESLHQPGPTIEILDDEGNCLVRAQPQNLLNFARIQGIPIVSFPGRYTLRIEFRSGSLHYFHQHTPNAGHSALEWPFVLEPDEEEE